MRLLGYVRVSTKEQSENFSMNDQENKIRSFCNTFDHELIEIYKDTFSGASINRKGLNELLEKLSGYDGLIVYKLDRLSRSAKHTLDIVDSLKAAGKTLISVSENIDISTPQGKLFLTMISGFAEYEREVIKERVTNGRRAKKETGAYAGGQPRLGKKVKHEAVNNKIVKSLIDNSEEQKVIQVIKNHKRSGKSLGKIAEFLNGHGYVTKHGKEFTAMQVKRALDYEKRAV